MIKPIKHGYEITDTYETKVVLVRTEERWANLMLSNQVAGVFAAVLNVDQLRELAEMATSVANRIEGFSYAEDGDDNG